MASASGSESREIPLSQIRPNPHQPRTHFDEEALASLAASIAELGVLQPVLLRPVSDEEYELVAGERRWRAAYRAALLTTPALGRETTGPRSLAGADVGDVPPE